MKRGERFLPRFLGAFCSERNLIKFLNRCVAYREEKATEVATTKQSESALNQFAPASVS